MEGIGFRAALEYFIREIRYMHMQQKVFCNISRSHFLMFFQIWPSWTSRICFLACTRENSYYICPLFCLHELALTFVALMNFINMFPKADTAWKCITTVIVSVVCSTFMNSMDYVFTDTFGEMVCYMPHITGHF